MRDEWEKLDPIQRLETRMLAEGWAAREEIEGMRAQIQREVDEAVAWAEASPFPDAASLLDGVYEAG